MPRVDEAKRQRPFRFRKPAKINREQVLKDRERGLTMPEIALKQGVSVSTIYDFLTLAQPEQDALKRFKTNRADVLAHLHLKAVDVKQRVLDSLRDAVMSEATLNERVNILHAVNASAGTDYDKERLERGQSTSNLGVLGKVIHEVHQGGIHKKMRPRDTNKSIGSPTTSQSNQSVTVEIDG